jgi:hypothetical protein
MVRQINGANHKRQHKNIMENNRANDLIIVCKSVSLFVGGMAAIDFDPGAA